LANEEARAPFNLSRDLMLRCKLVRLGDQDYVILLMMHHIASDGWSLGVLKGDLAAIYLAFSHGQPSPLPDLSVQYADFALWQRERLQGEILEEQLTYWRKQLAGAPILELPTDRPRPKIYTHHGAAQSVAIQKDVSRALKELSRQAGTTLFMTLMAAFKVLLLRYTGQEDIVVATPIANRNRSEVEKLIGFFVNTLVLRTQISGNCSFVSLLEQVKKITTEAYSHQDFPFEKLVEDLHPERDLSRPPLSLVMFALQNAQQESTLSFPIVPQRKAILSGQSSVNLADEILVSEFDLELSIVDTEDAIVGTLIYNRDLFNKSTINRLITSFNILLEGIVANPKELLCRLPVITVEERRQLLGERNNTHAEYPKDAPIHKLFEFQAARTPHAIAAACGDVEISYQELNERANQLADYLRTIGVGPEKAVGIYLDRGVEQLVGMLGILKAGSAYLPIDPVFPEQRRAFMLNEARADVLITQRRFLGELSHYKLQVICLDSDWSVLTQFSKSNPVSEVKPENLAYIIYTSGTAGNPKGILVPHRALVNHSAAMSERYKIQPQDRVLQFASICFDVAAEEIYPTLLSGATTVINPGEADRAIDTFVGMLARENVTVVNLPTSFWHEWASEPAIESDGISSSIRLVIVGTEQARADRLKSWQSRIRDTVNWINAYGSTETTITATVFEADHKLMGLEGESVPIGRPIANCQAYLLDQVLCPVPVGVAGELYIGGDGVTRGYLGRPDLTAEMFIPDPFGKETGSRLFKTGDLGRYLEGGVIEYLRRQDRQVKVRGFRIELSEIEAALEKHPLIRQAVVVARENLSGGNRLVAYLVVTRKSCEAELWPSEIEDRVDSSVKVSGEGEADFSPRILKNHLRQYLPEYMAPAEFVILDELPLTPSGKLDRKALSSIDNARRLSEAVDVVPQNDIERRIAAIWEDVLQVEKIRMDENFFDLGGHSLLTISIHRKVRERFNVNISVIDLFKYPTIRSLATYLIREMELEPSTQEINDSSERVREGRERLKQRLAKSRDQNRNRGDAR
jgi:amino acid adenylation domain-containing protein